MKEIAAALVAAQKEFSPALKHSTNSHFRNRYAALDACIEAVMEPLNAAGIFLTQPTHETPDGVTVETVFIHTSGERYSAGKLFVPASKRDAQGFGSALTYARRYSLMAACGIAPEDDDGNAAAAASKKQEEQSDAPAVDLEMIRQSIENAPNLEVLQAHFKAAWLQLDKGQRDAIKPTYDARKAQLIATEGAQA